MLKVVIGHGETMTLVRGGDNIFIESTDYV